MRTCQACGRENPDDQDFCECGEYLRWEPTQYVQAVEPTPPKPVPEPQPEPQLEQAPPPPPPPAHGREKTAAQPAVAAADASLTLRHPDREADPGETVASRRRARPARARAGAGPQPERDRRQLRPARRRPARRLVVDLPRHRLPRPVRLGGHVRAGGRGPPAPAARPRGRGARVGAAGGRRSRRRRRRDAASAPLALTIQPYSEYATKAAARAREGPPQGATSTVDVANQANAPVLVALEGADPDGELQFGFDRPPPEIAPGQTVHDDDARASRRSRAGSAARSTAASRCVTVTGEEATGSGRRPQRRGRARPAPSTDRQRAGASPSRSRSAFKPQVYEPASAGRPRRRALPGTAVPGAAAAGRRTSSRPISSGRLGGGAAAARRRAARCPRRASSARRRGCRGGLIPVLGLLAAAAAVPLHAAAQERHRARRRRRRSRRSRPRRSSSTTGLKLAAADRSRRSPRTPTPGTVDRPDAGRRREGQEGLRGHAPGRRRQRQGDRAEHRRQDRERGRAGASPAQAHARPGLAAAARPGEEDLEPDPGRQPGRQGGHAGQHLLPDRGRSRRGRRRAAGGGGGGPSGGGGADVTIPAVDGASQPGLRADGLGPQARARGEDGVRRLQGRRRCSAPSRPPARPSSRARRSSCSCPAASRRSSTTTTRTSCASTARTGTSCRPARKGPGVEKDPTVSPDGTRVAFTRDGKVFLADMSKPNSTPSALTARRRPLRRPRVGADHRTPTCSRCAQGDPATTPTSASA